MTICVVGGVDLGAHEKQPLSWPARLTFNPTGSTVAMAIGATVYPMAWIGTPADAGDGWWVQYAITTSMFVGSLVPPVGTDVELTPGRYIGTPIVTRPDGRQVESDDRTVIIVR